MLPLPEYPYNISIHTSTDRSPFAVDVVYTPFTPLDFVASLHQHDDIQNFEGSEFFEQLQVS
jgi:hypothetical protein